MDISLNGHDWKFACFLPFTAESKRACLEPADCSWWPNGTVPGNVQLDLISLGVIADPYVDMNSRAAEWVHNRQWVYSKTFILPDEVEGKRIRLVFGGAECGIAVFLNGRELGRCDNPILPTEFDVTDFVTTGENRLSVLIELPCVDGQDHGSTEYSRSAKPPAAHGRDFTAQCIPVGISGDITLIVGSEPVIRGCWADTHLAPDLESGSVTFHTQLEGDLEPGIELSVEVFKDESIVGQSIKRVQYRAGGASCDVQVELPRIELWWPNGLGGQNLYHARLTLKNHTGDDLDERELFFGFKQARLLPNPGSPDDAPPFCLEINGRKVFVKGWNWVPIDLLRDGDYSAKYERLIKLAAMANVNLLRLSGDHSIEKSVFYDLCDRHGIMVWQEFPRRLARSKDQSKLKEMTEGVVSYVRRHVSHTIWCGGGLVGTGGENPELSIVEDVCAKLDPGKPFASSPVNYNDAGDFQGRWLYLGQAEHYRFYNELKSLFHSEAGCEGGANPESLSKFIKTTDPWPPDYRKEIWVHKGDGWSNIEKVKGLFGDVETIEEFLKLSQMVQWEGLRYIAEGDRRRQFACGGVIPWQFNEPWPTLVSTNAVDYYTMPKMAYYAVVSAYEPVHVSAEYSKLAWQAGETFNAQLWVSNEREHIPGAGVQYSIMRLSGELMTSGAFVVDMETGASIPAGCINWTVPDGLSDVLVMAVRVLDTTGGLLSENHYLISSGCEPILAPLRFAPHAAIRVLGTRQPDGEIAIEVGNDSQSPAIFVAVEAAEVKTAVYFKNNHNIILPGSKTVIRAKLSKPVGRFKIAGWNTNLEEVP